MKIRLRDISLAVMVFMLVINPIDMSLYAKAATEELLVSNLHGENQTNLTIPSIESNEFGKQAMKIMGTDFENEITSKRTEFGKQYKLKNGNTAVFISARPIHFEDQNGEWQEIDLSITSKAAVSKIDRKLPSRYMKQMSSKNSANSNNLPLTVPKIKIETGLSQKFNDGHSIANEEYTLALEPVGAQDVTGTIISPNKIQFLNPWLHTDVQLEVNELGIREIVTFKSNQAPKKISYRVKTLDREGYEENEAFIQPATLVDAEGHYREIVPSSRLENGSIYIDYNLDTESLIYPLRLYQSFNPPGPLNIANVTRSGGGNSSIEKVRIKYTTEPPVGQDIFMDNGLTYYVDEIGLIKFDLSGIPSNAIVNRAELGNMDHWGVLYGGYMIKEGWGDYYPEIETNVSLETILERWIEGEPNEGLLFLGASYPIIHDWSNAVLYMQLLEGDSEVPLNLKITQKTSNSVTLKWQPPVDSNGLDSYFIYERNIKIGTTDGSTEFIVPNISIGQYSFTVKTKFNDGRESAASNTAYYNFGRKRTYFYNEKNQLIEIVHEGGYTQEFVYDANGNLLTIRDKND